MSEATNISALQKRRSLLAFAASKATESKPGNGFSIVLPIFRSIASDHAGDLLNKEEISATLDKKFGLNVGPDLIDFWIPELLNAKVVTKTIDMDDGTAVYHWSEVLNQTTYDVANFDKNLDELVFAYQDFARNNSDLFTVSATDSNIIDIIFNGVVNQLFDTGDDVFIEKSDEDYYFGRFVQHLQDTEQDKLIEFLSYLRLCSIIVDLIFHLWTPSPTKPNLIRLKVYIDAPIVMDALGLNGRDRKSRSLKLFELLKELNASVVISDFYIREIYENIDGFIHAPSGTRRGKMWDAMRRGEVSENIIRLTQSKLDECVEELGISVEYDTKRLTKRSPIDETHFAHLFARMSSSYQNEKACKRDIESFSLVLARRTNQRPKKLENAIAIFVTSNPVIWSQANRYATEQLDYKFGDVPCVIQLRTLAGMMAGYFGIEKSREISVQELLASASSAVAADPQVFEKLEKAIRRVHPKEADELIPLLRTDFSRIVLDGSAGRAQNVTDDKAELIVEKLRRKFSDEADARAAERFKSANKKVANERDSARGALKAVALAKLGERRKQLSALAPLLRNKLRAQSQAYWEAQLILGAVLIGICLLVSAPFLLPEKILLKNWAKLTLAVGASLGVLIGFLNREFVTRNWIRLREHSASKRLFEAMNLVGLDHDLGSSRDLLNAWRSERTAILRQVPLSRTTNTLTKSSAPSSETDK